MDTLYLGDISVSCIRCMNDGDFMYMYWENIYNTNMLLLIPHLTLATRHAIEVNKRDYRAWYGLGQTYEILKMPFYCLYYYRKAHQLRYGVWLNQRAFMQVLIFYNILLKICKAHIFCDPLWCTPVGPMTHACWLHWAKVLKNCHSKLKPRRYACYNSQCLLVCALKSVMFLAFFW